MKLAIVRTANGALDTKKYNVQEIGLGKALLKKGVSVDIYSTFKDISEVLVYETHEKEELKLIPIKGFAVKQVTYYPGLINKLTNIKYDVVQVHEDSQFMSARILKSVKKLGAKTVLFQGMYEEYSGVGKRYQKLLNYFTYNTLISSTDYFFSKTETAKKYLIDKGVKDVVTIPVGLDIKENSNSHFDENELLEFKQKFSKLFLYVGVLEKRRDILFLLEAFAKLLIDVSGVDLGLIIVGKGPDLHRIKEKMIELKLENNILLINSVPNNQIGSLYKICDLFVLPSHYEIYGMVVLEALYNGLPVFSTPTAGPKDIIGEEYLGKIIPFDVKKWTLELKEFVQNDTSDDKNKVKRKNYILNSYHWDIIALKYISAIGIITPKIK